MKPRLHNINKQLGGKENRHEQATITNTLTNTRTKNKHKQATTNHEQKKIARKNHQTQT